MFKVTVCNSTQNKCVENIPFLMKKAKEGSCLPSCTGLILKSFTKTTTLWNLKQLLSREWSSYKEYKIHIQFPKSLKGDLIVHINIQILHSVQF